MKSELNHFCQSSPAKEKNELNHFLPTGGLKSVQSRKLEGCKKLTFFPGTALEPKVILITYEAPTRPAESDFNHSENQHNAPVSKLKKYAISMFFRFCTMCFSFSRRIEK